MIKLEISTHSGDIDEVSVETFDSLDVVEQVNNQEIQAIAIGNNVYSRIDLKNIRVIENA